MRWRRSRSCAQVYSGSIGYETDHIQIFEERAWLREAIESRRFFSASAPSASASCWSG